MSGGLTFGERVARVQLQAANNGEDIDQFAQRFHDLLYLNVRAGWYSAEQATQGYEDIMNCVS